MSNFILIFGVWDRGGIFCYGALSYSSSFVWLILWLILWLSSCYVAQVAQSEPQNFLIDFHLEFRMALFFGSKWALSWILRFGNIDFWIKHAWNDNRIKFQVNWSGSLFWLQMSSFGIFEIFRVWFLDSASSN